MTQAVLSRPKAAFLTARWSNLAIVSYAVPRALLEPLIPPECELDELNGRTFVSLVAFEFLDTRVWGIGWPGARNFSEINLRLYVRHQGERGVCFVREFVPCPVVARMAKFLYNEPYLTAAMTHHAADGGQSITVRHDMTFAGQRNSLYITGRKPALRPVEASTEHFFKEHNLGFGTSRRGRLISYRAEHPIWDVYPVESFEINWNWRAVYGEPWTILRDRRPDHVLLAVGSPVRVMSIDK
jgi:uncharacterized protein YqjF (DUF2071 family)